MIASHATSEDFFGAIHKNTISESSVVLWKYFLASYLCILLSIAMSNVSTVLPQGAGYGVGKSI